jgi:hypothetical protein
MLRLIAPDIRRLHGFTAAKSALRADVVHTPQAVNDKTPSSRTGWRFFLPAAFALFREAASTSNFASNFAATRIGD